MIESICTDCGSRFYRQPDETWKRRCLPCWKASKATARPTDLDDEYLQWFQRGFDAGRQFAEADVRREPIPFDQNRLRQLLQLCHPDKHGGSDLAQRVTQWLNEVKRRVPA